MKIRERLARFINGKEFVHSAVISNFMSMFGWSAAKNPVELIKKVKGWSYTCINRNAMACSQVPLRLYRVKGTVNQSGKSKIKAVSIPRKKADFLRIKLAERIPGSYELEEIVEHPMLDLLRNVNPTQNAFDLKNQTFQFLETIANAYWYKERGAGDEIINIWPLMSHNVKIIPDKGLGIKAFEYGSGENKRVFDPKDIVHFKFTSLTDPFLGSGPMEAGEQAIDLYDYMNRFEIASFKNGGRPGTIMSIPIDGFMDEAERKRIESEFRRKYSGVENQGKFMITTGGAELKEFGFSPQEMSFTKGRTASLEEICGVFGVPMSFVKIQEISRANMWASLDLWTQYTINPRLIMVEQKLNEQFTPDFGEGLFLLFDDARPKDGEFRLKEIETHINTKYSSVNEERALDGLEPVEWGEKPPEPPAVGQLMPDSGKPADNENDDAGGKGGVKTAKSIGPGNPLPDPDFMPLVFRTQITIMFKELEADVVKNLNKYKAAHGQTKMTTEDLMSFIFDKKKWEGRLEADMLPFLKGIMIQGIVDSLEKLDPGAVYNASSPAVLRALENRKGQMKSIIGTTEEEIRDMLKEGIENGESRSALIKRIRENFDARFKADRVVRSESIWAHNEGTMQGWKQSGVVTAKQWDTAEDERTCPFCAQMHGKIVGIDGKYMENGDTMTIGKQSIKIGYGDVLHPPLHPGCRCSILPVLIED